MNNKITYSKKLSVNKYNTFKAFGTFKEKGELDPMTKEIEVEVGKTISEYTFYFLYLSINNILQPKENKLTETEMIILSAIMEKSLDFNLPVDSKDNKLSELAKELSTESYKRTPNSIYQATKRLRDKAYLVTTEDKLIFPNKTLQELRGLIKKQLDEGGVATFDYLFKCVISNGQDG